MSDGFDRPMSLAAAPLGASAFGEDSCPLAVLPCLVMHLTGRFPTFAEES